MMKFELLRNAACSREEKLPLLSTIMEMLALQYQARREGFLALEEKIEDLPDAFARDLLSMVINSMEPDHILRYAETFIAVSGLAGATLLKAMIILEAMRGIQAGDTLDVSYLMLKAYLGADGDALDNVLKLNEASGMPETTWNFFESNEAVDPALDLSGTGPELTGVPSLEDITTTVRRTHRLSPKEIEFLNMAASDPNPFLKLEPEVVATMVLYLDRPLQAGFISSFHKDKQVEILRTICDFASFDPGFYSDQAKRMLHRIIKARDYHFIPAGGTEQAARILRDMDGKSDIITSLAQGDKNLADQIASNMVVFEDLLFLDYRSIQKLFREVDTSDLAQALIDADAGIVEKVFNAVTPRARKTLHEQMEIRSYTPLNEKKASQLNIAKVMARLQASGMIVIDRSL
jgi:hypothetical protein